MIVYVITSGSYSDYGICAVATNKEKAARLRRFYSTSSEEARIEEYDTEDTGFDEIPVFSMDVNSDGNISDCTMVGYTSYSFKNFFGRTFCEIAARDINHAIKIARDEYARRRAEENGI